MTVRREVKGVPASFSKAAIANHGDVWSGHPWLDLLFLTPPDLYHVNEHG